MISVHAMRAALPPVLRPVIRVLALGGIVLSAHQVLSHQIVFDLTVTCVLPANQGRFVIAQGDLEHYGKELEKYRADCRRYPDPKMGLKALVTNPGSCQSFLACVSGIAMRGFRTRPRRKIAVAGSA